MAGLAACIGGAGGIRGTSAPAATFFVAPVTTKTTGYTFIIMLINTFIKLFLQEN